MSWGLAYTHNRASCEHNEHIWIQKHLFWNTLGPISLCLLKLSLIRITQLFSLLQGGQSGGTHSALALKWVVPWSVHTVHILCAPAWPPHVGRASGSNFLEKTVVCFLSQLASKEQPGSCPLPTTSEAVGESELAHQYSLSIQRVRAWRCKCPSSHGIFGQNLPCLPSQKVRNPDLLDYLEKIRQNPS